MLNSSVRCGKEDVINHYWVGGYRDYATSFDAYGNSLNGGGMIIPFGYGGAYKDSESGLMYLNARYYDSGTGRFTQEDTFHGDGANLYIYCSNDPVNYTDPSGHWKQVSGGWQAEKGDTLWGLAVKLYGNGSKWTSFGFNRDPKTLKVGEIIKVGGGSSTASVPTPKPAANKSIDQLAKEVIRGDWGNGAERKNRLTAAGYNYNDVQEWVNQLLGSSRSSGSGSSGGGSSTTNTVILRDVTNEIAIALRPYFIAAQDGRRIVNALPIGLRSAPEMSLYYQFYKWVTHGADWDIKRKEPWEKTIGTKFPGSFDTPVYFCGMIMTPEQIGNYTYGFLGAVFGFSYNTLLNGSYFAAGLPNRGFDLFNEINDWYYVRLGYLEYR